MLGKGTQTLGKGTRTLGKGTQTLGKGTRTGLVWLVRFDHKPK